MNYEEWFDAELPLRCLLSIFFFAEVLNQKNERKKQPACVLPAADI